MKLLHGVSLNRQSGAKDLVQDSTQPCCATPQRMSGRAVCAVLLCMIITTIRPTQRSLYVFSGRSTDLCCREKHRNLLLVIPRRAGIAVVMTSGPGFAGLCNTTQQCYANWFIAPYRRMKWAVAQRCWEDFLTSHAKPVFPLRLLEVGAAARLDS